MSTSNHNHDADAVDGESQPQTIAERIAAAREGLHPAYGGIIPFPAGITGQDPDHLLRGREAGLYERLYRGGYRPTPYAYRSAEGETLQIQLRLNHREHPELFPKRIMPLSYFGPGVGYYLTSIKRPWPLYGLDKLAARPDAPVLVTEGEKACEAAALLFPDHVAITWMSGASNVRHAEMLSLKGRDIVLWPDNDPPGRGAMRMFAAFAFKAGAASVKIVDVPSEFGEKWDLADSVPAGCAAEYPLSALLSTARQVSPSEVTLLASGAREQAEQRRLLGYKPGYSRVKLEYAETALSLLDADMYGTEWRKVARCLFYAFGDEGLAMFDAWSRASKDKYRDGEPAKLWKAFHQEPAFRGESLAWLFRRAAQVLSERPAANAGDLPNIELDKGAMLTASVEELSESHAVIVRGSKTAVLWESYDPRFKRYAEIYLAKRDFVDRFVSKVALPDGDEDQNKKSNKRVPQGELWFGSGWRRSYDGVHFAPGEEIGPRFLNTWRGFTVDPVDDPAGWSRFKEHLLVHVAGGDQASYTYLLNWLAFAIQKLDRPIGTALILIGKKGAGKSIVTELFGHLFGQHTFVTPRMEDVIGRFNDRLETTVLLGLEEAVAPQNRSADGTLKDLVTRSTLRLEGKFFGVWDAPNHLRIIVTSNNEHVVRADGSERRYAVFEVTNPHQADPNTRRRYFGQLVEQMEAGGYSAMLGELLSRDIAHWNPEVIPETEALKRQKVLNLVNDPVRSYLYERLQDGIFITNGLAPAAAVHRWSETETVWVPARDLQVDFMAFAETNGLRATDRMLAMQLPRYMPEGFKSETRRGKDGDNTDRTFKAYPFPPLEEARGRFEEVTGLPIERES